MYDRVKIRRSHQNLLDLKVIKGSEGEACEDVFATLIPIARPRLRKYNDQQSHQNT